MNHTFPSRTVTALPVEWANVPECEHLVQFYEHESFLLDSLMGFILAGLRNGDRCIVVATQPHRDALDDRLQTAGVSVFDAIAADQYIALDAAETLSRFMVDGQPNPEAFREVVGSLVGDPTGETRPVRVFGEMVALLWASGKHGAAARLEGLWNELARTHRFSLFCAYPIKGFYGDAYTKGFTDICDTHSKIIPSESYVHLSSVSEQRRSVAMLQQRALSLELEVAERKRAEQEVRRLNEELKRKVDEYARVVQELEDSRLTLNERVKDLEMFHDLAVGRELKMMALEKELNQLKGHFNA